MFYKEWFFLDKEVWNNAFSFEKRNNKKIYVPSIIDLDINDFEKICIQNNKEKIAFEDYDFDDNLSTNYWLKNFYRIKYKWKEIILFDNHNHAFYFWYEARSKWMIWNNSLLFHIDEHADTRDNNKYISNKDSHDLSKVFEFTNYVLNVGDYIIPAQQEGLIWKTIQIRNTKNLEDYIDNYYWNDKKLKNDSIILNLDLDFFQPDLDFIDYNLKKKVVLDAFDKADFVTVCTSPFFIDQNIAIDVFKDIFGN